MKWNGIPPIAAPAHLLRAGERTDEAISYPDPIVATWGGECWSFDGRILMPAMVISLGFEYVAPLVKGEAPAWNGYPPTEATAHVLANFDGKEFVAVMVKGAVSAGDRWWMVGSMAPRTPLDIGKAGWTYLRPLMDEKEITR